MEIRQLTSPEDLASYDRWIKTHPEGSLWQSLEWKQYQEALGRETRLYGATEETQIVASALVIIDRTALGLSTWDIPRGPLVVESGKLKVENFVAHIISEAKKEKCMIIFLSPSFELSTFHFPFSSSPRHEQPEATRIINLTK